MLLPDNLQVMLPCSLQVCGAASLSDLAINFVALFPKHIVNFNCLKIDADMWKEAVTMIHNNSHNTLAV